MLVAVPISLANPCLPPCKRERWDECKTPSWQSAGVCILCKHREGAVVRVTAMPTVPCLYDTRKLAIQGYPFRVLSAKTLPVPNRSEVEMLYLLEDEIQDIVENALSEFSKLHTLGLDFNRLTRVRKSWFTGLVKLNYLTLSNNRIAQIDAGCFEQLKSLLNLNLEHNLLQAVDPVWFAGRFYLSFLFLGYNRIRNIPPKALEKIRIFELGLRGNGLSCLELGVSRGGKAGIVIMVVNEEDRAVVSSTDQRGSPNNATHITCILLSKQKPSPLIFDIPPVQKKTHGKCPVRNTSIDLDLTSTPRSRPSTEENGLQTPWDHTTKSLMSTQPASTVQTTPDQHLSAPNLKSILIPIFSSVAGILFSTLLIGVLMKKCQPKCQNWCLRANIDHGGENEGLQQCAVLSGLPRSVSLPVLSSPDDVIPDDAASCRSLPAALTSIQVTYCEIPDDIATAQRPLPALPTHLSFTDNATYALPGLTSQGNLNSCTHQYGHSLVVPCTSLPATIYSVNTTDSFALGSTNKPISLYGAAEKPTGQNKQTNRASFSPSHKSTEGGLLPTHGMIEDAKRSSSLEGCENSNIYRQRPDAQNNAYTIGEEPRSRTCKEPSVPISQNAYRATETLAKGIQNITRRRSLP
ncbi:hypothetical protein Bbelb_081140 [Branchiostoma belcheri]|nr:hypothetical protein Bbelb_081140 [Branchiostoma belcheri]